MLGIIDAIMDNNAINENVKINIIKNIKDNAENSLARTYETNETLKKLIDSGLYTEASQVAYIYNHICEGYKEIVDRATMALEKLEN